MQDRKIDIEALTEEQLANTIKVLGEQIKEDINEVCEKHNKKLSRYGLCCKMQVHIVEK